MSSFKSLESFILPQAIDEISATKKLPLGTEVQAKDTASTDYGTGTFIYLKGLDATAVGSVVTYNRDDHSTALLAANAIGPVAVAMSACVTGKYGFYQIVGKAVGKVLAAFADNANCYATATAGSIDDAVVAGDLVKNMKGASAIDTPSTGLAELEIDRPFMDDGLTA
jgi:hypothetical protein